MSTLRANAITTTGNKPILNSTGSILQVVSTTLSATSTSTVVSDTSAMASTDGVQVGSLSITPSASTSNILVIVSTVAGGGANSHLVSGLFRGTTNIASRVYYTGTSNTGSIPFAIYQLDSPSTISQVTYSLRVGSNNGANTQFLARPYYSTGWSQAQGQMILMEVSG